MEKQTETAVGEDISFSNVNEIRSDMAKVVTCTNVRVAFCSKHSA